MPLLVYSVLDQRKGSDAFVQIIAAHSMSFHTIIQNKPLTCCNNKRLINLCFVLKNRERAVAGNPSNNQLVA